MKQYPSIPVLTQSSLPGDVFVFDKLDGSNIRAEWNIKSGFAKFGSRKQLIDENHWLGSAVEQIRSYNEPFKEIAKKAGIQSCTCFFELHGPGSFAGQHVAGEALTCSILDVDVYKKGYLPPKDFVELFVGVIPAPTLLHTGPVTKEMVASVQDGTMPGMTREGVVCKLPAAGRWGLPVMYKIKSRKWIQDVTEMHGSKGAAYLLKIL